MAGLLDPNEVSDYITQTAPQYGVDPDIALKVAKSEGLYNYTGDNGTSFGPFQLHYGGGLGDVFTQQTGLNASDPSTWKQQVNFALSRAQRGGWAPWHGATRVGITGMAGINGTPQATTATAQNPTQGIQTTMPSLLDDSQPQQSGGLLGGLQGGGIGPALMALGAGIASGGGPGGGGWGGGIGKGLAGATEALQRQQQLGLQQAHLLSQRYRVDFGPNGQPIVIDTWQPQRSGMIPMQNYGTPAPAQPSGTPGVSLNQAPEAAPSIPGATTTPQQQPQTLEQAAAAPSAPNAMAMTRAGVQQIAGSGADALKVAQTGAENAKKANIHLGSLTEALDKLSPTGPLSAGPFEETAAEAAGKLNDLARRASLPMPFDQNDVANLEVATKEAKQAGLTQGRAYYGASREGQQTIQLLQKTVPNPTMSPLGRRMLVAQTRALNQRDIDYADFLDAWMKNPSHPGDPTGAPQAFDKIRPPQYYADMADKEISQYGDTGYSPQQSAMTKARDAIAKGADKTQVMKRLVKAGFNPSGL